MACLARTDPFRKIGFIVASGNHSRRGDCGPLRHRLAGRATTRPEIHAQAPAKEESWKKTNTKRLVIWVVFWAVALTVVASQIPHQPVGFVLFGIGLVFVFLMINGIADGISDWNPISTAFVMAVLLMALLGLKDPGVGLMCAAILLLSCGVGVDMQQDRSTGWRLGTNRAIQFRYQVIGIVMGAVMAVGLAQVFMAAYPVLTNNAYAHPESGSEKWQSAMTLKIVGALDNLSHPNPIILKGLVIGVVAGLVVELIRKFVKNNSEYKAFAARSGFGRGFDFVFDAVLMPSPYAASFGGFVTFLPTAWFGGGSVVASLWGLAGRKALAALRPR